MKTFYLHNSLHLGDCIYQLIWMKKYPEHKFYFFVNKQYIQECSIFSSSTNICILPLEQKPELSIETWIGHNNIYYHWMAKPENEFYDKFYLFYFEWLSSQLGIENKIKKSEDLLSDDFRLLQPNRLTKSYDFLIINSIPHSGQLNYNEHIFKEIIYYLSSKYSVCITKPIDIPTNSLCTMDYGLNLMEIANIAINSRNIFAVHTAPHILSINKFNFDKVKDYVVLHNQEKNRYSYSICKHLHTLEELLVYTKTNY